MLVGLLAAWLAAVAWVTLRPAPAEPGTFDVVRAVIARLDGWGLPVTYDGVERAANVVMFVPGGLLLAALLLPGRGAGTARGTTPEADAAAPTRRPSLRVVVPVVLAGAALSSAVELSQAAFLPTRVPTVVDVVMNTAGAAVGALLAPVAVRLLARVDLPGARRR
ncbi:VanZ like family protein [Cellulomonas marina]|uniref:VanZ like family protein n=1 Tax=Cellulomonas marina TaxID=988821 RepID=A0A1I1AN02_9CELL|nr:VanZ like family protein [Cellulomonas marina]